MKFVDKIIRKSDGETLLSLGDTYKVIRDIKLYFLNNKALSHICMSKAKMCVGALIGKKGKYVVGLFGTNTKKYKADYSINDIVNKYFTYDFNYLPKKYPSHTSLNLTYFLPIDKFLQYRTHHKIRPWRDHRPDIYQIW